MDPATRIRRNGALLTAPVQDELVGLDAEAGTCFGFNATAARVWTLLEREASLAELVERVTAEFDVEPVRCHEELAALLGRWQADGLVALDPPSP